MRRLSKSSSNKIIDGVLGGLASYINIDPVIVRIIFLIFAFTTNPFFAFLLYIGGMVIMPRGDHFDEPMDGRMSINGNIFIGGFLIFFGGYFLLDSIFDLDFFEFFKVIAKYLWAFLLIVIGIFVIMRGRRD